jgi:hypothetical protein
LFDSALLAFEIRFERALDSRWFAEEQRTQPLLLDHVSPGEKRAHLYRFFENVKNGLVAEIHKYFPVLLRVAITQREHLNNVPPLTWTNAQVLTIICNFLGIDEEWDENEPPRIDSRALASAERITTGGGWLDDGDPLVFCLPEWADYGGPLGWLLAGHSPDQEAKEGRAYLTPAETLQWVKGREFWIRRACERQIDNENWDGIMESGALGISVLEPCESPTRTLDSRTTTGNVFRREGDTWVISFSGEECRLERLIGLNYIAELLRLPGQQLRPLQLQVLASGRPIGTRPTDGAYRESLAQDTDADDEGDDYSVSREDFGDDPVLDAAGRQTLEKKKDRLEREATDAYNIGNNKKGDEKRTEYEEVEKYLKRSLNVRGRSRRFSSENEKARTSVTKALGRAFGKIREQAPAIAKYLENQIETGSVFTYRDAATVWIL